MTNEAYEMVLGLILGVVSGPDAELNVAESRVRSDTRKFRNHHGNQITRHFQRCLVAVPYVVWHPVAVHKRERRGLRHSHEIIKAPVSLHWSACFERHVTSRRH